jgi:hypothetical protein
MGKPTEADAQFEAAAKAGIPVITIMSGSSPHALFDIAVNEYQVGAQAALWLLGRMNYRGGLLTTRFEGNTATRIRGKVLDAVLSENQAVTVVGSHAMARTASWQDDVRAGMQALLLRNRARFQGVWASFDGQAYVIDDLLQAQDFKKGRSPSSLSMAARKPTAASPTRIPPDGDGVHSVRGYGAARRRRRGGHRAAQAAARQHHHRSRTCCWMPSWWTRAMCSAS